MTQDAFPAPQSRSARNPVAFAGALAGGLLFAYTLHSAGTTDVLTGIRRVGFGFGIVLLLAGLRMLVRAKAWALCVEPGDRFSLRDALAAFIAGDAIGNVTPLGPVASEGTKALLSRRQIPTTDAFSSVVLENIFYGISVAIMLAVGTLAFLLGFRPTRGVFAMSIAIGVVAVACVAAVWWLLRTQPRLLSRFLPHESVRTAEDKVFRFAAAHPERIASIITLELLFHVSAVIEIALLLWLLVGNSPRLLLLSLVLETVERVITIAFKFVPLRLGVDQAGSGLMASMLGLTSATGVTIATVRTARNLFWSAVGLVVLLTTVQGRETKHPEPH